MQKKKRIPEFKSEDEERDFWATHSFLDYHDGNEFRPVSFPNLKPTTKSVSIRLPVWLIANLKRHANKRDIPYQSLIKNMLVDDLLRLEKRR